MKTEKTHWLVFRCLRWTAWLSVVAYYMEFYINRRDHLNSFGQLLPTTEFWMFILPLTAIFLGFFELALRERAGLVRPAFGRHWAGKRPA